MQNVKDNQCRQTINWDNISSHSENEDEINKPNKITYVANATATIVECSNETSTKSQGTVQQILIYFNCMFNIQ